MSPLVMIAASFTAAMLPGALYYLFAPQPDLPAWAPLRCPECGHAARVAPLRHRRDLAADRYQHQDGTVLCPDPYLPEGRVLPIRTDWEPAPANP